VTHGIDVNGNGAYDAEAGKSSLDRELPPEATAPAAYGMIEGSNVTDMPDGGVDTGSGPGRPDAPRAESTRAEPAAPTESLAQPMAASEPASVRISSLDVEQDTTELGLQDNGAMEIPQAPEPIGWYTPSPTPGERGPFVLAGHLTWNGTDGVFRHLDQMSPGEQISVSREDGSTARFEVTAVETYATDEFPTVRVYGNTTGPELRLITCGGEFDPENNYYSDNVVVYAELV